MSGTVNNHFPFIRLPSFSISNWKNMDTYERTINLSSFPFLSFPFIDVDDDELNASGSEFKVSGQDS